MAAVREEVRFYGHPNVMATHPRTIEITKEAHLTARGDCIVGVRAEKGLSELTERLKEALKRDESCVRFTISTDAGEFVLNARGSRHLPLESRNDIVIRKSDYVCDRTIAIGAEAAASEIPRSLVASLKSPAALGTLRIEVNVF